MERKRIFIAIEKDGKGKRVEDWGKEHVLGLLGVMKNKRADLYAVAERHFANSSVGERSDVVMCMEPAVDEVYGTMRNKQVVSFNSVLTETQIEVLVELVNELSIFAKQATVEKLATFFRGEITGLKVRNLRLFCALMTALANHEHIGSYWQAPIYRNGLLLSPQKNGTVNRRDLAFANYAINNVVMDNRVERINHVVRGLARSKG